MRKVRLISVVFIVASVLIFAILVLNQSSHGEISRRKSANINAKSYRDCKVAEKIVFLKTHKCASSTVQNVILRHAKRRNLTMALPATGNYLGRYKPFHTSMLYGTPWAEADFDVFCLHTIWNGDQVRRLMKAPARKGVKFFSILRDPVELFRSLWDYAELETYFRVSLEDYAKNAGVNQAPFFRGINIIGIPCIDVITTPPVFRSL